MASSTKWRLYVTTVTGASACIINELQLFDDSAVNLCTGGTPSASSDVGGAHTASIAFDGNLSTYWQSANSGTPWWLQYEFASSITPTQYSITVGQGVSDATHPLTFELQYWDGSTWQVADAQTENTWDAGSTPRTRFYGLATKRSWRLRAASCQAGTNGIYIAEIQFRTAAGGANQATDSARCRADHIQSPHDATKTIDGNAATRWYSTASALPHDWIYTFATQTIIAEYTIQASADFPEGAPKNFTLEYYDGSAWQVVDSRISQPNWSAGEVRTYSLETTGVMVVEGPASSFSLVGSESIIGTASFIGPASSFDLVGSYNPNAYAIISPNGAINPGVRCFRF